MIMAGLMSYSSNKHMTETSVSVLLLLTKADLVSELMETNKYISSATQHQQATSPDQSIIFCVEEQMLEYFSTLQFYASGLR